MEDIDLTQLRTREQVQGWVEALYAMRAAVKELDAFESVALCNELLDDFHYWREQFDDGVIDVEFTVVRRERTHGYTD